MSNQKQNNRPRGPMGHGMRGGGEKAKDFKGTMGKLIKYMSAFKIQMLFVVIFAIGGTVFNIIGPKILGKATTEIFNGLVSKVSGGSGMDFEKIATILLTALALYVTSALCSLVQGFLMTGVSQKTTYRLRKEISQKIFSKKSKNFLKKRKLNENFPNKMFIDNLTKIFYKKNLIKNFLYYFNY